MSTLSKETIQALCDAHEMQRLCALESIVTADIKSDQTEVVRIDFTNENDGTIQSTVVLFENSKNCKKKQRR